MIYVDVFAKMTAVLLILSLICGIVFYKEHEFFKIMLIASMIATFAIGLMTIFMFLIRKVGV